MMPKSASILLIVFSLAAVAILMTGAEYLERTLPGGLPIGNAVATIGLVCAAAAAVGLSQPHTKLRYASLFSAVAAFLWLPLSIALAGNLALNFSSDWGPVWLWFSLITFVTVLLTLLWAIISRMFSRDSDGDLT